MSLRLLVRWQRKLVPTVGGIRVAMIAGFSEKLVPGMLSKVEAKAQADAADGGTAGDTPPPPGDPGNPPLGKGKDKRLVVTAASQGQKAADYILDRQRNELAHAA